MVVTGLVTNDVKYGQFRATVGGHVVIPAIKCFGYGECVNFTCSIAYGESFNGWYVYDEVNYNSQGLRKELPASYSGGAQWTDKMQLCMNYTGSVVVVADLT